jgi:hypothetical protein
MDIILSYYFHKTPGNILQKMRFNGEKMTNWTPVIIGIVLTIVIGLIGIFIPFLGILAPIIGGFVAAYMAGGDYKDGAVNGGIAGAFGGALLGFVLLGAFTVFIGGLALGFIIGLILGIIGGTLGIIVKGRF